MQYTSRLAMILLAGLCTFASAEQLQDSFRNPPPQARPWTYWFWMHGNVTAEGITADLESMQQVGLGGFQVFDINGLIPAGPIQYMTDEWRQLMHHAAAEADRLGLKMCLHSCAGWSSSGGPWITPEHSMKKVVVSETPVEGPGLFEGQLPQPAANKGFYRDIIVLAYPTPQNELFDVGFRLTDWPMKAGFTIHNEKANLEKNQLDPETRTAGPGDVIRHSEVIDISHCMDESGQLTWNAPAGRWTVLRLGYTTTGETNRPADPSGTGLECDKLSKKAAELHWNNSIQKVLDDAGPLAGKTFDNVLIDSFEVWCQNWTEGFDQQFQQRMGYDLTPYLPTLTGRVVDSVEVTERFLWDFRQVISEMFIDNYFGHFAETAHRNGLVLSIEPYGSGNFNDFRVADCADIALSEWWARDGDKDWHHWSAKLASSAMHVHGRKYTGGEAFTTGDQASFLKHPFLLKPLGDYFLCKGVNRFVFHTYVHQPWLDIKPGMTMGPWGGQYNRGNTWFFKGRAWLQYLARCQYLLQEGRFVADLCYLTGEQAPQHPLTREDLSPPPPIGYDYDFCSAEMFKQMSVESGELVLPSGMRYRMLVLPPGPMRPTLLRKVCELVKAGANIYGPAPQRSPGLQDYPACDQQVKAIADDLWGKDHTEHGEHQLGAGKVFWGRPLAEVLAGMSLLPDFAFTGGVSGLPVMYGGSSTGYIHRRIADAEVYFVTNPHSCTSIIQATFRVSGKRPQLWHPDTGQIEQTLLYSFTEDGRTTLPLKLDPSGSVFVVFREPNDEAMRIASVSVEESPSTVSLPALEIDRAYYVDVNGTAEPRVDVTGKLQALVSDDGQLLLKASDGLSDDPAAQKLSHLCVEYSSGGVKDVVTIIKSQPLILPRSMGIDEPIAQTVIEDGKPVLITPRNGSYQVQMADGHTINLTVEDLAPPTPLEGPWTLHFPKGWVPPEMEQITLDRLIDWSQHENDDIRHFSGTATYIKQFNVPAEPAADEKVLLDLGQVRVMAQVMLNGHDLGILWKPPFRMDITDALRSGNNVLEIEVTNLWVNRLIKDSQYPGGMLGYYVEHPIAFRPTSLPLWLQQGMGLPDNGRKTFVTWPRYQPDSPLVASGMMGAVRLIYEKVVALQ